MSSFPLHGVALSTLLTVMRDAERESVVPMRPMYCICNLHRTSFSLNLLHGHPSSPGIEQAVHNPRVSFYLPL
jgi:hypothetical protein